ncbi:uncharacterized protein LOC143894107 [Temnothorax americanus]|uniref:uncharacterized protein LOC143894107 n=1 Tax=Temnothorax americanus TaxID=1964332 RepID=UPI0040695FED
MAPRREARPNLNAGRSSRRGNKGWLENYLDWRQLVAFLTDPRKIPLTAKLLIYLEIVLNVLVIYIVPYTEIDWRAYMQEVGGFLNGTTDYSKLRGDTGPLVYPAGFVYVFSGLYLITSRGANIRIAQYFFAALYVITLTLVFRIYARTKKVPPYVIILMCCTSYRIHSIFVLRLFNDSVAMVLLYASINAFLDSRWYLGSALYSLAVSIKMNILLFAPALLVAYLCTLGTLKTLLHLSICALIQLILGLPFLLENPVAYIKGAFNLGRVFEFKWTVNWRFLPEEVFVHPYLHVSLLLLHMLTLLYCAPVWITYVKSYAKLKYVGKELKPQLRKKEKVDMSTIEEIVWSLRKEAASGSVSKRESSSLFISVGSSPPPFSFRTANLLLGHVDTATFLRRGGTFLASQWELVPALTSRACVHPRARAFPSVADSPIPNKSIDRDRFRNAVQRRQSSKMALVWLEKMFLVIVAFISLRLILKVGILVWKKLIASSLGFGIDFRTQGKWAVVTGATDGLGKAFADVLAEQGMDIVLVSRSLSKLKDTAAEIERKYRVETRVVEADLTEGQVVYAEIGKVTQDLEVGVLVNNAGASYDHPEMFTKVSEEVIARILQLNVAGVTGVARAVLPGMMQRGKGVLINVSSMAAAIPSPYLAVYAASKAYIDKLSADLATEAAPRGVTVQCVLPGPVATKMSKIKRATWMAPTPETFVKATLKTVGIESRTTGYPPHCLISGFVDALRYMSETGAVWLVTKTILNIRGRALRKKTKSPVDSLQEDVLSN